MEQTETTVNKTTSIFKGLRHLIGNTCAGNAERLTLSELTRSVHFIAGIFFFKPLLIIEILAASPGL